MVPSTSVLRFEIDIEVRRLSVDPCELCDIAGRPCDVYETSNFDVECLLFLDGPIDVGVLTGMPPNCYISTGFYYLFISAINPY